MTIDFLCNKGFSNYCQWNFHVLWFRQIPKNSVQSILYLKLPEPLTLSSTKISDFMGFLSFSHVPMFIQIGDISRKLYFGTCIGGGFRTSYEMVQLKYTPHECSHVQGMIDTFKSKLVSTLFRNVFCIFFDNNLTWKHCACSNIPYAAEHVILLNVDFKF